MFDMYTPFHPFRRKNKPNREGAVSVELAFVIPVLLLLIFGVIESCNLIYLKQSLTVAAYEGARAAVAEGSSVAVVNERSDQVLLDRRVKSSSITITPSNFTEANYGSYIAVEVTCPYSVNSIIPGWFFNSVSLKSRVRMMKEY
jgi:Flp pilus assembly protein TadG